MTKVFYIDPQSGGNLEEYDRGVLGGMEGAETVLLGSTRWKGSAPEGTDMRLVFSYHEYRDPLRKGISYIRSLWRVVRMVRRERPQVVHIQWLRLWYADWIFLRFLQRRGIKVVHTAHNLLPHNSGLRHFKHFSRYYHAVNHIIVHSPTTKREMMEAFGVEESKISVIHHGILDFHADEAAVSRRMEEIRRELRLGEGELVFSALGAQSAYKGIDTLISVWANTPGLRDNNHLRLLFVGRNSDIDYTPVRQLHNVFIRDEAVSEADFLAYVRLSDVSLLPYKAISQSGVLFTSLSNGVPVLVSHVGGLPDVLDYGKVGWDIGHPSFENLQRALLDIVSCPGRVAEVKANKVEFRKVNEAFSWPGISKATEALYNTLANR